MRILVIVPWGERLGGAEKVLHLLVEGGAAAGYGFELVFLQDGAWPAELRDLGYRTTVIPAGRMREAHRWAMTVRHLASVFRRAEPDIILNWSAKTQIYGSPAAVLAGMTNRVVWWQHAIPDGGWLDRVATLLPATAIGCCCETGAAAQRRLLPPRRLLVVFPGINVSTSDVREVPLDRVRGSGVIGIVGRLQPWKGQDRVLRAHALLRERGHSIHTIIVGGDAYGLSPGYARDVSALISELALDGEVTMTGHVDDARPYIRQMDILVNASDPEPFGIVLLEAMAMSVPVVAVASGGPAEFIENWRTGMLARSGAPGDLAEALERLLTNSELRDRIGRAGCKRVRTDFTDTAMCDRFSAALDLVASGRVAPTDSVGCRTGGVPSGDGCVR